ncbi:MAG: polysaccharide deacetylase family protein [Verrucomicrobiales bacterium]|nr:polysaccharide deacetylase family protein [Verrucomicrobiales bacterium]MCP5526552.1 polysaccharide deacetylase family protein [Verrucomicrobiales bacterium]
MKRALERLFRILPLLALAGLPALPVLARAAEPLTVRLGYKATDRLVIVNCDDVGMCHAANEAVIDGMENGLITSGTIMVPCPWFPEIAAYGKAHPAADFGIHLCHTAEWRYYRWGPVLPRVEVPGLVDPDGNLWRSIEEVYGHATPEEALAEGRAQIRKALAAGVDITHLDSHMGTLQYDLRYFQVYVKLAAEFDLPLRMASQETLAKFGQPNVRETVAAQGIVFPDYLIHEELGTMGRDVGDFWRRVLKNLKPGVTELYIHAAKPTAELQAITGSWRTRGAEYETFTCDAETRALLEREGIIRIGYRPLRDLQRKR